MPELRRRTLGRRKRPATRGKAVQPAKRARLRQVGQHHVTREAILEAARELYAAGGYAAVSMREVAQRIGFSAQAIYHYFVSKEEIFLALQQRGLERLRTYYDAGPVADPLEDLRLRYWRYYEFSKRHPEYFMILYVDPVTPVLDVERPDLAGYQAMRKEIDGVVERCIAAGVLPATVNIKTLRHVLLAAVHGPAVIALTGRPTGFGDVDTVASQALDAALAALRTGVVGSDAPA
jgi:AcrR family transcriptional regulator